MTAKRAKRPARPKAKSPGDNSAERMTERQIRTLLHELQVHSEEIRVQNEQLIKAQGELEQARDRYADLYDYAPIGYVSLDPNGDIADVNLAGAVLLGGTRRSLLGMPFSTVILRLDADAFQRFLAESAGGGAGAAAEVRPRCDPQRIIRLLSRPMVRTAGAERFLVAMVDVTEELILQRERQRALENERERAAELDKQVAARRASEDRVKALLERIVTAQEEERRRIARNLHDHLGQQLTALRLTVTALRESQGNAAVTGERLDLIDKITSQIDRDVDFLAWDLRPPALDDVGLGAALESLVHEWAQTQNVRAQFHAATVPAIRLAPGIESHLYRIVQEALNNVSKHANASAVSVMLEQRNDQVIVVVEDNGRGFDVATAGDDPAPATGMGLTSMQERAALIGGEVEWESTLGAGTTVFVRIPCQAADS